MLNNEIKTCINEFAKNNGISLNSELSKYDDFGKVCIDIVSTINISHIGNLFNSLTKLCEEKITSGLISLNKSSFSIFSAPRYPSSPG